MADTPQSQSIGTVELRLRAAVESSPSGILMIDNQGRIVLLNREVERLFGYSREELLGRNVDMLVPERFRGRHPAFRAGFLADPKVRAMGAGRDLFGLHKDGTEVPVEIGLTPVATEEGMFVLSSVVDITARRQAEEERRRLEEQLRHAQRIEAVGTLAAGIAHDFNNILGTIVGYAELARDASTHHPTTVTDLEAVLTAAHRGKELVQRLLQFSQRHESERRPLDLAHCVGDGVRLLRAMLPAGVEAVFDPHPVSAQVLADATSVHQVLMNLATNAVHAMPSGGRLTLSVTSSYVRDSMARANPELSEGPYAVLHVQDTGAGIPPGIRDRIFEPFFTTKPAAQGTGLGLPMVRRIMQDHRGAVLLESAPSEGTTVSCFFPAITAEAAGETAAVPSTAMGAGQRVLYVDDEPNLGQIGQRRLESLGYRPTVESDPHRALERFLEDPTAFDLVVTDYSMPGLTGLGLAEGIRRVRPDIPIVLHTGVLEALPADRLQELDIRCVLTKPTAFRDLAGALAEALRPPD